MPYSCFFFFCSGPTSYPARESRPGFRVGAEYALTGSTGIRAAFSRTSRGTVRGFRESSYVFLNVSHDMISLEGLFVFYPGEIEIGSFRTGNSNH